jgi:hypothetical protein
MFTIILTIFQTYYLDDRHGPTLSLTHPNNGENNPTKFSSPSSLIITPETTSSNSFYRRYPRSEKKRTKYEESKENNHQEEDGGQEVEIEGDIKAQMMDEDAVSSEIVSNNNTTTNNNGQHSAVKLDQEIASTATKESFHHYLNHQENSLLPKAWIHIASETFFAINTAWIQLLQFNREDLIGLTAEECHFFVNFR